MGDIVLHMCTNFRGHVFYHQLDIGTFSLFINLLPEAICCCLQTCYVAVDGLCVYTNFHCCHSLGCLVAYTNSPCMA